MVFRLFRLALSQGSLGAQLGKSTCTVYSTDEKGIEITLAVSALSIFSKLLIARLPLLLIIKSERHALEAARRIGRGTLVCSANNC